MTHPTAADEHAAPTAESATVAAAPPAADAATAGPRPGDPAGRELAEVAEVMAQVRAGVRDSGSTPEVPGDDEVAGLERAHETLRSTLDRVDRQG